MLDNVRCMQHATCSQGSAQSDFFQVRRDQSTSKRSQCSQQDEIEKQNILSKDFVPAAYQEPALPLGTCALCQFATVCFFGSVSVFYFEFPLTSSSEANCIRHQH
jgi:hypothetical protein